MREDDGCSGGFKQDQKKTRGMREGRGIEMMDMQT